MDHGMLGWEMRFEGSRPVVTVAPALSRGDCWGRARFPGELGVYGFPARPAPLIAAPLIPLIGAGS